MHSNTHMGSLRLALVTSTKTAHAEIYCGRMIQFLLPLDSNLSKGTTSHFFLPEAVHSNVNDKCT